jgi:hypothetical protein
VLINPNGLELWRLPFLTVDMQVLQQFIPEWASPDFHQLIEQMMLWLLLAVFAAVSLSGQRMDGSDLVTLLIFAFMAMLARRNYGPFALVAVPVLTRYASAAWHVWRERSPWIERLHRKAAPRATGSRTLKTVINLSLAALLGLVAFGKLYVVTQPSLVGHYVMDGYPSRAAAWLADHQEGGRMLNEYNWGGYLQWALPGYPTFVDGRTDLFGDEVIGDWIEVVQAGPGWADVLSQYQVDLVMLEPGRPLLSKLPQAGWKLIYQDTQVVIYGKQ